MARPFHQPSETLPRSQLSAIAETPRWSLSSIRFKSLVVFFFFFLSLSSRSFTLSFEAFESGKPYSPPWLHMLGIPVLITHLASLGYSLFCLFLQIPPFNYSATITLHKTPSFTFNLKRISLLNTYQSYKTTPQTSIQNNNKYTCYHALTNPKIFP